ncbi:MAG: hypothetical protein LCH76_06770 [Actinobacteria bacterium]|nr:hypothetical protein [Actinomycetota bacterium]
MAEIRKFDPAMGNAIAQALRAAMGDPVRPATPGEPAGPAAVESPDDSGQTAWLSLRLDGSDQNTSDPTT